MDIAKDHFVKSLSYLLLETFEGSPEGQGSAFLDHGVGIFNTLENLSAEAVSREINGITVVAHTEHAKFYLDRLCEFLTGRTERVNWEQSWLIDEVDETEWSVLREAVRASYQKTLQTFQSIEDWSEMQVGMAMGMIAHTAYHLGAIRQIAKAVNQ